MRTFLALLSLTFIFVSSSAMAQAPAEPAAEPIKKADKSLLDLYHEGGPVMHIIAACSVATLALSLYCFLTQSKKKLVPDALVATLKGQLAQRDVNAAATVCRASPGPLTSGLLLALTKINPNRQDFGKTAMENAVADHCFREETKMMVIVNYLNTFAVMAPMIGLLGTTSGMITSFGALTAGKAEASELAGGIGEALVATAGGLFLAIPAMFLYFHFRGQAQTGMAEVHKTLNDLIDTITEEPAAEEPA